MSQMFSSFCRARQMDPRDAQAIADFKAYYGADGLYREFGHDRCGCDGSRPCGGVGEACMAAVYNKHKEEFFPLSSFRCTFDE